MLHSDEYTKAYKMGKREVALRNAKGENPYLPALDEIPGASESIMEYPLGLIQIPTDQIAGTKTKGRSHAFAANFMPILGDWTEFGQKWINLCNSHLEEGIREPIKAYEYMNKFYVLEGNKRVSVLKFFDAVSITGYVTRIVPPRTEEKENKIYYEYMDFYKLSQVNYIWFTELGCFTKLQRLMKKRPDEFWTDEDRLVFSSMYARFCSVYKAKGGDKLCITPGDAFLDFLEIYGKEEMDNMTTAELGAKMSKGWKVFDSLAAYNPVEIQMKPKEVEKKVTLLKRLLPASTPVQKIAFVHETDPQKSGWTYAHDLGRMHLEQTFPEEVHTTAYCLTSQKMEEQEAMIEQAVRDGNKIIFTTSPVLTHATIKAAVEHPDVKFLNCSLLASHGFIRTYSARMYEAKFLMGAIAGALSEDGRLGFLADYPIYGTVANINAFALGAKMVNPRAKVVVEWTSRKQDDVYQTFRENNVSYVSGRDIIIPGKNQGSRHFGVFRLDEESPHNIAMPIWHWGIFYEKMIRNIMDGNWKNEENSRVKSVNYWWGMSSGVIDVICSQNLPLGTTRLVNLLEKTICEGEFNPFEGVLYSQKGVVSDGKDSVLTPEKIITMDWLAENVIGEIPRISDLEEKAKQVVLQQGVKDMEGTGH